jgi:hypothetical protein
MIKEPRHPAMGMLMLTRRAESKSERDSTRRCALMFCCPTASSFAGCQGRGEAARSRRTGPFSSTGSACRHMAKAREAVAWTFGMNEQAYRPVREM